MTGNKSNSSQKDQGVQNHVAQGRDSKMPPHVAPENPRTSHGQARTGSAPRETSGSSPPGLDQDHHAAEQRTAQHAELLREEIFPALMAEAVGLENTIDFRAYKIYLEQLLADA